MPAELENTASAAGRSQQQNPDDPDALFPIGDTSATVNLSRGAARIDIDKDPDSRIAPGETAPITLVIENTGESAIPDLYVRDPIPDQLEVVPDVPGAPQGQPYTIIYEVPAGTPEPPQVAFTADTTVDPGPPSVSYTHLTLPTKA